MDARNNFYGSFLHRIVFSDEKKAKHNSDNLAASCPPRLRLGRRQVRLTIFCEAKLKNPIIPVTKFAAVADSSGGDGHEAASQFTNTILFIISSLCC
jgi:hypothetical protein